MSTVDVPLQSEFSYCSILKNATINILWGLLVGYLTCQASRKYCDKMRLTCPNNGRNKATKISQQKL